MTPAVQLSGVTCSYSHAPVLEDISLQIQPGQFVGLVGPSGSGKTTLLKAILGQIMPQRGSVSVFGQAVRGRPPAGLAYVPQLETVDWNFPVTVEQVVLMGCAVRGWLPWPSRDERRRMHETLERLGMADLAQRHIRELSGGQQQRVFLARALITEPQLVLLDEPTSNVDLKTRDDILHLLGHLNSEGMTIIMTTHELNAVAAHLPWVVCINRRLIAQGHPSTAFTAETLGRTYGVEMLVIRRGSQVIVADRPHHIDSAAPDVGGSVQIEEMH